MESKDKRKKRAKTSCWCSWRKPQRLITPNWRLIFSLKDVKRFKKWLKLWS